VAQEAHKAPEAQAQKAPPTFQVRSLRPPLSIAAFESRVDPATVFQCDAARAPPLGSVRIQVRQLGGLTRRRVRRRRTTNTMSMNSAPLKLPNAQRPSPQMPMRGTAAPRRAAVTPGGSTCSHSVRLVENTSACSVQRPQVRLSQWRHGGITGGEEADSAIRVGHGTARRIHGNEADAR
jgi:hypothetical protein